jgi:hypothetical protein
MKGNPRQRHALFEFSELEQCCPHAVVPVNCRSRNFTRTGRTDCPPGAVVAVAFAKLIV